MKKDLKHNGIFAILEGIEKVSFTEGSGDDEESYYETRTHIDETIQLIGKEKTPSGEYRFPFQFVIPSNVPSSYDGVSGDIQYRVTGKIERSWRPDTRRHQPIFVVQPAQLETRDYVPTFQGRASIKDGETTTLSIEFVEGGFDPRGILQFMVMIGRNVKIKGIRASLVFKEKVIAEGRTDSSYRIIVDDYFEESKLARDTWINITLESRNIPLIPFGTQLIRSEPFLKISLDIPRRFDKGIDLPLYQIDENWRRLR
ncbi:MAG: hypothetical protein ACTSV2_05490 [Candidatus Thorarchaeota archaeon]